MVINATFWLATCQWFFQVTPVSSTNKIDRDDITEVLFKVALNTINQPIHIVLYIYVYHNCVFQTTIYLGDTQNHSQILGRFQIA
jgi:hypothetical protein